MTEELFQSIVVGILLVAVMVAFVSERLPSDLVAMSSFVVVIVFGIVDGREALALFGNETVITIGAMFVLSGALEKTGALQSLASWFSTMSRGRELRALMVLALLVLPLSAFVNNTPVVVIFLPILIAFAQSSGIKVSRLLMPLSFFSILGGTITLLGTSTNLIVNGVAISQGLKPFGIFEISILGLVYASTGMIYFLTIGRRMLPSRDILATLLPPAKNKGFFFEAKVTVDSPLIGKTFVDSKAFKGGRVRVFEIVREGERVFQESLRSLLLAPGDVLVLNGSSQDILDLREHAGLDFRALDLDDDSHRKSVALAEAMIGPRSAFVGKTLDELQTRSRFRVVVVAVHRKGENLRGSMSKTRLRVGDALLIEGQAADINQLEKSEDFLSLTENTQIPLKHTKAPLALFIMFGVVILAAFNVAPISVLALVGAVAVLLFGCLDSNHAYGAVDWRILFLIVGMLGLGKAMEETGLVKSMVGAFAGSLAPYGPVVLLAAIYVIASITTELITNSAVAILLTPIAIGTAMHLGYDPRGFVVAVMFGASASFMTPIGYQTNTYIYATGCYRFGDFMKVGLGLQLLLGLVAVTVIPIIWPF
jgi:di/tricarboxylate transporter